MKGHKQIHIRRTLYCSNAVEGGAPEILQKIGLPALPMTFDTRHTDYAINDTKDEDHHMGAEMLKKLPEMLKDPVAIIESATRQTDSLVTIVEGEVDGKQMMAAVEVGGLGIANGTYIDANIITSAYGRKNAITTLLTNAIKKENTDNNSVGVYYWKKSDARSLYARAGGQFPGAAVQDGLIHSIYDAGSSVNKNFVEQTETQQFNRWFKGSKVVNEDGTPKVVYHGSLQNATSTKTRTALQERRPENYLKIKLAKSLLRTA